MENFLISLIYQAACAGLRAGKVTYLGHQEMMNELYEWIRDGRPTTNWTTWSPYTPRFGWRSW